MVDFLTSIGRTDSPNCGWNCWRVREKEDNWPPRQICDPVNENLIQTRFPLHCNANTEDTVGLFVNKDADFQCIESVAASFTGCITWHCNLLVSIQLQEKCVESSPWQMCVPPFHLWGNLWQNLPIDPIASHPHPSNILSLGHKLVHVFIPSSLCLALGHQMSENQLDNPRWPLRGVLVPIGDQLAPARPQSAQDLASTAETCVTRLQTH